MGKTILQSVKAVIIYLLWIVHEVHIKKENEEWKHIWKNYTNTADTAN